MRNQPKQQGYYIHLYSTHDHYDFLRMGTTWLQTLPIRSRLTVNIEIIYSVTVYSLLILSLVIKCKFIYIFLFISYDCFKTNFNIVKQLH